MAKKLLVNLRTRKDAGKVRKTGCKVLAEYPDSLLVRCTKAQVEALGKARLESAELPDPEIGITGLSFRMASAAEAEASKPIEVDPNRKAYYLVQLVGPPKGEWLEFIRSSSGTVESSLKGFRLLVGILASHVEALGKQRWAETIVPFRPAMKVSAKLRPGAERTLTAEALASVRLRGASARKPVRVEISVFSDESTEEIAAEVRAAGGSVVAKTSRSIIATVTPAAIARLADRQAVQSISPHEFSKLANDVAANVIHAPVDRVFADLEIRGDDQIVAVADSGLDTGNAAAIHADFAGRITTIVSWATNTEWGPYTTSPTSSDDGAADTNSGHGTHVAGSVLGDGDAAVAAGATPVCQGIAPEGHLYFQAIEQEVTWRTLAQLAAVGRVPFTDPWPPKAVGLWGRPSDLNDLFQPAYNAGARIHTNSWGAPWMGGYTGDSRAVDEFMWNNRDMLILFAAGNEGRDDDADGLIDPDSINSPSTAKNCLTVGAGENDRPSGSSPAPGYDSDWDDWGVPDLWPQLGGAGHLSDDADGMAAFSSRGPTDDGRLKPELVAPGSNVLSVRSSMVGADPLWGDLPLGHALRGLYCWCGGTSMSTPLVAGAAALVRQHLVQQRGHVSPGEKPSGALIKAFLVNAAESMNGGQYTQNIGGVPKPEIPDEPNNVNGFGRAHVFDTLTPGALARTLFADEPDYAVETGEMRTFEVQVIDTSDPLKVTLVWTDAPAPAGLGGLESELYLQVVRPNGTVVDGDVTAFPAVSNNTQRVVIETPVAGTYVIRVRGVSVTTQAPGASAGTNPRQDFALVVSNGMGLSMQEVSIAQAIDTTGSMGYYGYMEPAKDRAEQLVDFLRINDKVSITEFSQRSGLPNDARTPYSLRLLGSFSPDWTEAHTAIGTLGSSGRTPIGAGLQEAWNQLSGEPVARPRGIVLLSDGLNNELPDPATVLPGIPVDVPIFTIALGPAADVPALQAIAGSRPNGGYYAVESDEDIHHLHEIYANVQALAAGAPLAGLSSAQLGSRASKDHEVPVEPGAKEAVFTLSWERRQDVKELSLKVVDPGGAEHHALVAGTMESKGSSYRVVRVAAPKPGKWTLVVGNPGSRRPVRYTISQAVRGRLSLDLDVRWSGEREILIDARLRRGPRIFDGAAKIVAQVTAPSWSKADVLKKHYLAIARTRVPKRVLEKGLTPDQVLLLRLAEFARKYRGDLYGRKTVRVVLTQSGAGSWRAKVPVKAAGTVHVDITAHGGAGAKKWRRAASRAVHVPETLPGVTKLSIKEIKTGVVRIRREAYIAVRLAKPDGTPATLDDFVTVDMALSQGVRRKRIAGAPFERRPKWYVWRLPEAEVAGGEARLTVTAKVLGTVAAKARKIISF